MEAEVKTESTHEGALKIGWVEHWDNQRMELKSSYVWLKQLSAQFLVKAKKFPYKAGTSCLDTEAYAPVTEQPVV